MSKEARPIWRAAEKAVGLPKCPPDMSSPRLACFLFDSVCMVRLCQTTKLSYELIPYRNVMKGVAYISSFHSECAFVNPAWKRS